MENMSNQWKKFEELSFEIQKKLSPQAIVKLNDKIRGKSGRSREIDITIRQKIGQFDLLVVIDCKNYKKPVDIKTIESFIGQIEDIGAHQGGLVSSCGYTKSAIERAKVAGINLYHLGNTLINDLNNAIGLPALCSVVNLKEVNSQISFSYSKQFEIQNPPIIYNNMNEPLGCEADVLANWWFTNHDRFEPGRYSDYPIMNGELFFLSEGELIPIEMEGNFTVERLTFYRVMPINFIGYKDVIKEQYEMQQITTAPLSIESIKKDWSLVDESKLAIKPIIKYGIRTIHVFDL